MGVLERIGDKLGIGNKRAVLADSDPTGTEIVLNVTSTHSQEWSDDVTNHAIEKGADITDNIRLKPFSITLSVILTDSKAVYEYVRDFKTVKEKLDQLLEWRRDKKLLTFFFDKSVFTKLGQDTSIDNVVISSLATNRASGLGNGIAISLSLKEIIIAETGLGAGNNAGKKATKTDTLSDSGSSKLLVGAN